MESKTEGRHRGHNVVPLEEASDFIRETLGASIKRIEGEIPRLEEIQDKAIDEGERIQSKKDQAKELVQRSFSELRRLLNAREAELMDAIENTQLGEDKLEQFIPDLQNAIGDISSALERGKALFDSWSTALTPDVTQDVLSVIGKTKEIRDLKRAYSDACGCEIVTNSCAFEDGVKRVLQSIKDISSVGFDMVSVIEPKELQATDVGPFFVMLEWAEQSDDENYTVAMQKEGSDCTYLEFKESRATLTTLEPKTAYKFSVKAKRGAITSEWSAPLEIKTPAPTIESSISALKRQCGNEEICVKSLEEMKSLIDCKKNISL